MECFAYAFVKMARHLKHADIFEAMDERTAADVKEAVRKLNTARYIYDAANILPNASRCPYVPRVNWTDRVSDSIGSVQIEACQAYSQF